MAEKYTVNTSMPTGKSDPTYGTEYMVKFAENEGTFKLWYKQAPTEGFVQEGTIDGWKFTKAKKEYSGSPAGSASATTPTASSHTKPAWKDNSDGLRQGMCINNAANFVNSQGNLAVTPEAWAQLVHTHANALYSLGDLGQLPVITQEEIDASAPPKTVKETFGL